MCPRRCEPWVLRCRLETGRTDLEIFIPELGTLRRFAVPSGGYDTAVVRRGCNFEAPIKGYSPWDLLRADGARQGNGDDGLEGRPPPRAWSTCFHRMQRTDNGTNEKVTVAVWRSSARVRRRDHDQFLALVAVSGGRQLDSPVAVRDTVGSGLGDMFLTLDLVHPTTTMSAAAITVSEPPARAWRTLDHREQMVGRVASCQDRRTCRVTVVPAVWEQPRKPG